MPKKILYLSYFFEPDLGAGAFRNTALAKELSSHLSNDGKIKLVTTFPNRYSNLNISVNENETHGNLNIHRIRVSDHGNSFIGQINSFLVYRSGVKKIVGSEKFDLVFASSSKLFTAYLAYTIAKKTNTKLYLDLRDLFTENLKELLPSFYLGYILSYVIKILFERPTIKYATHLNLNSAGFKNEFQYRESTNCSFFPNGIDDFFLGNSQNANIESSPKVITYAGNIGEGQGLEKIIPSLSSKLGKKFLFRIIGSGSTKQKLEQELKLFPDANVELLSPVARRELLEFYKNSHYLFLHLNTYKSFEKVIPSKIFEYGAFNIPILAGVSGYPAEFIKNEIKDNVFVFKPCDMASIYNYLISHEYYLSERPDFINKFRRDNINAGLARSILQYV